MLIIADAYRGLTLMDVSNPASPIELSNLPYNGINKKFFYFLIIIILS